MSMVSIDVSQVHDLASDIRRNADEVEPKARVIVAAGAHRVVAAIQAEILRLDLVDTAAMVNTTSADVDGLEFEAGPTVEYAIYQDQGTSELPAGNFTGNGYDQVEPQIIDAVADLGSQILGTA